MDLRRVLSLLPRTSDTAGVRWFRRVIAFILILFLIKNLDFELDHVWKTFQVILSLKGEVHADD